MPMTKDRIIEIAESYGWTVRIYDAPGGEIELEFSQGSPAGEDFFFCVYVTDMSEAPEEIKRYNSSFDPNEHAKIWAESSGTRSIPELDVLVEDSKDIQKMINQLTVGMLNDEVNTQKRIVATGNTSLEEVLRKHFGCKKPALNDFRVVKKYSDGSELLNGLSVNGEKAFSKLTALLYDLEELLPEDFDANNIIEILDDMVKGNCQGLRWE